MAKTGKKYTQKSSSHKGARKPPHSSQNIDLDLIDVDLDLEVQEGKPIEYNAYKRRIINQRFYKLERSGLYKDSNKYLQVLETVKRYGKYNDETGAMQTSTWEITRDQYGTEVLRMRSYSKEEWSKLSRSEKEAYRKAQDKTIESSTTMKTGIEEKMRKAYETFMKNNDVPDLTFKEYKEMWRIARDMVSDDLKWDKIYDTMTQLIENYDIHNMFKMSDDMFGKALEYGANDEFFNIDKRFIKETTTNYTPKYTGGTTTVTDLRK